MAANSSDRYDTLPAGGIKVMVPVRWRQDFFVIDKQINSMEN